MSFPASWLAGSEFTLKGAVKGALYEGHCPLGAMCAEHLALHKQRGGDHCASGSCDVCKWNETKG